jgi:N-ethylmaleimide reductase
MTHPTTTAFDPISLGSLRLRNRIVMAPMTRSRAERTLANADMATYYAQRAGAGLIITEGIQPSAVGQGYPSTPGLHSAEQVDSWRPVTGAVHAAGGTIVAQLMHTGRIGHPSTTAAVGHGALIPVGPSAVRAAGQVFTPAGPQDHVVPVELTEDAITATIADFAGAARNAIAAGFDAVEVHGANGYLLDQFLKSSSNHRTDDYGGSIENRARFLLEVMREVCEEVGRERVGLRLSPVTPANDVVDDNPQKLFDYVVRQLAPLGIAYLHLIEGATGGPREVEGRPFDYDAMLHAWRAAGAKGAWMVNNGYDRALAEQALAHGADLVAFGRLYIANPDLVQRLRTNAPLNAVVKETLYGGGAQGYTDYPALQTQPA